MNRFFLNETQILGVKVKFPPQIAHQIMHVLRLHNGDRVIVLDDHGFEYQVMISIDLDHMVVDGEILKKKVSTAEPKTKITLCFGLSSREKVEFILQKGTEIGVTGFYPFTSSRTLVQTTTLTEKRIGRWKRIIREAAEQSKRGRLPILYHALSLGACCNEVVKNHALSLAAWEEEDPKSNLFPKLITTYEGKSIALFVGPEGGFSKAEIDQLKRKGAKVVSLGKRILRMETAAIIIPALILHDLGEI